MSPDWNGKPYYPLSSYYRARFGQSVRKVPVTVADTCPNRLGLKGMQTCVFCDQWGSAAYAEQAGRELAEQIREKLGPLGERYRAAAFLIYFQAYTSTFLAVRRLRGYFDTALSFPGVRGMVVGTRPDCLSPALMELWQEYHEKAFVSVELGVQTFNDEGLRFLRRGHDARAAIEGIRRVKAATTAPLCVHLIFGLPGESDGQVVEAARVVSDLGVDSVKLHNLHVLRDTPLAELYREGKFQPLERAAYADRVILFLRHLHPRVAVDRLVALSSRWDELVAPDWTRRKLESSQFILDRMNHSRARQGELCAFS